MYKRQLTKETEIVLKKQMKILDLKSLMIYIKNSLEGFNSTFKLAEEGINELEDRLTGIMHSEEQRKRVKKMNRL